MVQLYQRQGDGAADFLTNPRWDVGYETRRAQPQQSRAAPQDRAEDAATGGRGRRDRSYPSLAAWSLDLRPRRSDNISWQSITERARQNPKYPAGSHPDQQSLFSSIT